MAENLPVFQDGQAPLPPITYLPHAHPQTSFSNPDQDLDRQAMPPPPPPMVNNIAATLSSVTLAFRSHDYNPDIATSLLHDPQIRDAWMAGRAHDFHELFVRMDQIKLSVEMVRKFGNQAELAFIHQGLELYRQSRNLCDDMHTKLYGLGGPGHNGALGLGRDWISHLNAEFNRDIAGAETVARFFHDRKALCESQMNILNQMTQLEINGAPIPQDVINPLPNPLVKMGEGNSQPGRNQNLFPQMMEAPLASGVGFLSQDPFQAQRIIDNLPSTAQGIHSLVAAQNQSYFDQGRQIQELQHLAQQHEVSQLNSIPVRYGTTPAFSHQFDMVGAPPASYHRNGGRTNSFDRGVAMHGRQEFLAGMHAGHYDRVNSRRPTVASQGSLDGILCRWNSNSPQRQPQHLYALAVEQWQQSTTYGQGSAAYGAPYGGSRRQSYQSHSRDNSAGHVQWKAPDRRYSRQISRETSPHTSRGLSPAKILEPTGSKSPRKFVSTAQNDDSHSVASADHSHPVATSPMPSSSISFDMLSEWGRQHTPNASQRRNSRLSDLDVPTFRLDETEPSVPSVKSAWTPSLTTTAGPIPPNLRWINEDSERTIPFSYDSIKPNIAETHPKKTIESKKAETNQQVGGPAKESQIHTETSPPKRETFDSSLSPGDSVKMAEVDVKCHSLGEAPTRAQENEWQVAGPRTKKTVKEPTTQRSSRQKGAQKKLKEEQIRREPGPNVLRKTHKDKSTGVDQGQQREVSARGAKTKRPKKEASVEGRDEYPGQSQNTGAPYEGRRSKKGKGREAESDFSSFELSYLPDFAREAFPNLSSPADMQSMTVPIQHKDDADDAELVKMSWSSALKAQDFRVEAEKLRVAAAVPTPIVSRDASGTRRISAEKTPAPKGKASSGDLRATATPFTPPAAGQSLLITSSETDFSGMLFEANPLVPTWAARAALAANIAEEEATAPTILQLTSAERKAAKNAAKRAARSAAALASETGTASSVSPNTGSQYGLRAPFIDFDTKSHTVKKRNLNKLSLSEHTASMSVPTSTAGSVSSPSLTSVKSMPSTPTVRTWAHRAASAALYTAPPSTAKAEHPLVHSGNTSTPKSVKEPQPGLGTPQTSAPGSSKTVPSSAAKSNLSATASAFSYAAKLAAPAPLSMSPFSDMVSQEGVDAKTASAKSVPSSVRAPGKKGGKDKNKKSAPPNGPPPTIDASLMMVTSPNSSRASFASTATTSASSATLVSSETLSSEGASSAGVRDNTDVGGFQVVHTKGPYRPARELPEDGYNAPPPTPSPAETWAQRARHRYARPSLKDCEPSSEFEGESTLTASTGSTHIAGFEEDKRWRGGPPEEPGDVLGAAISSSVQKISQPREVVEIEEKSASTHGRCKGGSDDHGERRRAQGESEVDISSLIAALDAPGGGNALEDTRAEAKLTNKAKQHGVLESGLFFQATGHLMHGRESRTQSPKKIPKKETPSPSAISPTRRPERKASASSATHGEDTNTATKTGAPEPKQAEAGLPSTGVKESFFTDEVGEVDGAGQAVKTKDNTDYESEDSTGTVKGSPAPLNFMKPSKVRMKKSEAAVLDTPSKKIIWADADDEEDEWAGFEAMTTSNPKKLESGTDKRSG